MFVVTGPSLGTNLAALVDWSTSFPFLDLFRMSRPWITQRPGEFDTGQEALLDLDDAGWVRGFTRDGSPAPFTQVATILFTNDRVLPSGRYVVDWQGEGSVALSLPHGASVVESGARAITIQVTRPGSLGVNITETDPRDSGDHVRDIRIYRAQDAELIEQGLVFNPDFLDRIDGFRSLRFMDWMNTNNSPVSDWDDRRPGGWSRETSSGSDLRGASVEVMVALANQTRADPWFTIPHLATDEYIRNFATHVRDNLAPGLVARFEFSNEVWNFLFEQARWADREARGAWGDGIEGGWMQWYGVQAARMARIVAEVFGDDTGTRALNVFATQSGWQGIERYALEADAHVARGGSRPMDAPFHVYAIAPYFGASIGDAGLASQVAQWVRQGEAGYRAAIDYLRNGAGGDTLANIGETIAYHRAVADFLGWQLEAYEGGQHVVDPAAFNGGTENPAQTAFFINLVKRPEFEALYAEYFEIWRDNGGGLMAQFSDFGIPGRYGSWGIWDSVYSPDTPRARAVKAFRDGTEAWWGDDRPADTFDNGLVRVDRDGRNSLEGHALDDALFGLYGADRLRGHRGDDLLAGGDGADTLLGGYGDDRLLGNRGPDAIEGDGGSDLAQGGGGADRVAGDGGDDGLFGGGGRDRLDGGMGRDRLYGGSGDDTLSGDRGQDRLTGGGGGDHFVFARGDSTTGSRADRITDFGPGDAIHIDAAFGWRGEAGPTGSGGSSVSFVRDPGTDTTRILWDRNGDGRTDEAIVLDGLHELRLAGGAIVPDL
jgi:hypothetical protein